MRTVLVTGAAGFVGTHFRNAQADGLRLVNVSRRPPRNEEGWFKADFTSREELEAFDGDIDAVVHLGAVTGACTEREGMAVNVEGTRVLMRFAAERGCRRFVLASSIALVGTRDPDFRPVELPITEDHPCLDLHGYGFSKHLMEEVARYHVRQFPDSRVACLRLAGLRESGAAITPLQVRDRGPWFFNGFCLCSVADAVRAIRLSLDADLAPGVHTWFVGPPRSSCAEPVADLIEHAWGDAVDVSFFRRPGNERAALFCVDRIRNDLGFIAEDLPDWL